MMLGVQFILQTITIHEQYMNYAVKGVLVEKSNYILLAVQG